MGYLFILLCLVANASAQQRYTNTHLHSAQRAPNESANAAYQRYASRLSTSGIRQIHNDTPLVQAKPYSQLTFQGVPTYQSSIIAMKAFFAVRDVRFIQDMAHNMMRRSSWLFPDDGCFARAALMIKNLTQWNFLPPAKVFIFGDLNVKTTNSPFGSVSWWYHVVPLVAVGNQPVVFDPAINPNYPLILKDWIMTMTDDINSVKIAICRPSSYTPSSPCSVDSTSSEPAMSDQIGYLNLEWARLEQLRRDPLRELGELPPWGMRR